MFNAVPELGVTDSFPDEGGLLTLSEISLYDISLYEEVVVERLFNMDDENMDGATIEFDKIEIYVETRIDMVVPPVKE